MLSPQDLRSSNPVDEMEDLRRHIRELNEAVNSRERENKSLSEIISTIGSTLDLEEVLAHIVDVAARATDCHACFIYLWDADKEKLTLRAASECFKHVVGNIELELGEGLTGWSVATMQPIILNDQALSDPRSKYYPELEEEDFQSMMVIPIVSRGEKAIGAIVVHTVAPYEFSEDHLNLVRNIGLLVAGAIENAQLFENTRRKLATLTALSNLSQTVSSSVHLDDTLKSLAAMTADVMESDLCAILLLDSGGERLAVKAVSQSYADKAATEHTLSVGQSIWEEVISSNRPKAIDLISDEQLPEQLGLPKGTRFASLISAPLISGVEQLGLINCYTLKPRRFLAEDFTVLTTIGNQTAIAIKNAQLIDLLTEKNLIKDFFELLMTGAYETEYAVASRALALGVDLSKEHVVLICEIDRRSPLSPEASVVLDDEWPKELKRVAQSLQRRIACMYPGSIFSLRDNVVIGLVKLKKGQDLAEQRATMTQIQQELQDESGMCISVGIGNVCSRPEDYPKGFQEAREAFHIGRAIWHPGRVVHFNDLGLYKYLYRISSLSGLRDTNQEKVQIIVDYDRRKGTQLLNTLEIYLECLGNATKTAERLFIHRNTLSQRLDKIKAVSGVDPDNTENWLDLQIALKIVKFRQSGYSASLPGIVP
ncbi:MAG: GAF domain-containing protein [Chloroflexi bacterium]|nr:GAF domain-containing protein [Chloroflexota bacterium]